MSRLTKYDDKKGQYIVEDKYIKFINMKLGQLEDLMEKFDIESIEELEEIVQDGMNVYSDRSST